MRRRGLAERANVVASAFDRQQRCLVNLAWIDLAAVVREVTGREFGTLKHAIDRFDVEFFRQIGRRSTRRRTS